mgnify:CR=1 FL=1
MEKKNDKNKHEKTIIIDGDAWKNALTKAYEKNNKKAKIDGFRPGKAPYDIYVKKFGVESLFLDAADMVVEDAYLKAIEEDKLIPVCEPEVNIKEVDDKKIEFVFTIITKPELTIKKYKNLKIKKEDASVSEEEIDEEIKHLLEHYAELEIKDGKVENSDTVIIDYEGFVDGVAFEGGKAENYSLKIGSGAFIPGFEDQLIGMEKESEKEIEVTFPEDYHAENLKGQKATFKVKVHEIKTRKQRELDEEFFEDLGMEGVNSVETLRSSIKEHLETHKKNDVENKFVEDLMDAISKNTDVEIPDKMVEEEVDRLLKRAEENLKYQGISLDLYYQFTRTTEADLRNQLESEAFKNVLYRLILEEIIKLEKIEVTDEEIEEELAKMAERYKTSKEEIAKELGGKEMVKYDLEARHTFEKLSEYNEVK